MDIRKTYQGLLNFDPEEAIAYEYYTKHGEILDFFQVKTALAANQDRTKAADFSCLESLHTERAEQILKDLAKKYCYEGTKYLMLLEKDFIMDGYNVELNNGQRYIRLYPHFHDFFELECTILGKCLHTVENKEIEMQAGDIVIVPPGVWHTVYAYPNSITINIKVRTSTFEQTFLNILQNDTVLSDYFSKVLHNQNYKNSLTFHCGQDSFLFDQILYMYTQQQEGKAYANRMIESLLGTFFTYLIQNYTGQMAFSDREAATDLRMLKIEKYLRLHYRTATLASTAAHFYLSPPYLSAYIKKHAGLSFSQILRGIRMEHACLLLQNETRKVDDVCESVGYKDTTQFIRTFKKIYGLTPKQYQKKLNE